MSVLTPSLTALADKQPVAPGVTATHEAPEPPDDQAVCQSGRAGEPEGRREPLRAGLPEGGNRCRLKANQELNVY